MTQKSQLSPYGDVHNQKPHVQLMQSIQSALKQASQPKPHSVKDTGLSLN